MVLSQRSRISRESRPDFDRTARNIIGAEPVSNLPMRGTSAAWGSARRTESTLARTSAAAVSTSTPS